MAVVTRALLPDWLTTSALPFLKRLVDSGTKLRPKWYEQVLRMETTDRPHEQYDSYAKFGLMVQTDEGSAVTYDLPIQGFDKTLTPVDYSLG